jgi:hypothetical protein
MGVRHPSDLHEQIFIAVNALSDERVGLYFTLSAVPLQSSLSQV